MERNMNMPAVLAATTALATGGMAAERALAHPHPENNAANPELRQATDAEKRCAQLATRAFDGYNYSFTSTNAKITVDPQAPGEYGCNPNSFDRTTTARISEYSGGKFVKHLTNEARVLTPANDDGSQESRTIRLKKASCGRATRLALKSVVSVPGTSYKVTATERTKPNPTNCITRRTR